MSRREIWSDPLLLDRSSSNGIVRWLRWQAPYIGYCCAYFPVTLANRILRTSKRSYIGLDPVMRRLQDKWGFLVPGLTAAGSSKPIWINMYSGGEVLNARGLLRLLDVGKGPYILSTEAYDAFELLCRTYGRDRVFFPPWDLALSVRRDLRKLHPRSLIFVQNAYFPTLLREARRQGIVTVLINALLSRNYQVANYPLQRALALGFYRELDAISVQSEEDYVLFRRLGVPADRIAVTGNLAADLTHLRLTHGERRELRQRLGLPEQDQVMVVGSAPAVEQVVLAETFKEVRRRLPETRFIVAPRWIHEARGMAEWLRTQGFKVSMRSEFDVDGGDDEGRYDILVLDTFGELPTVYGVADVAFIGSSLVPVNERRGGHNPLEPLAHGVVPLFGPHMNLWSALVSEFRKAWPSIQVDSPSALAERASEVLTGGAPISAVRDVGARWIDSSSGAVEQTAAFLRRQLKLEEPL